MDGKFFENSGENYQKVYNSILIDPDKINILSNKLARNIVEKLSKNKYCAMDIARELKQHEQKIYYHLKKLEKAGIVKQTGTERRAGMIAKMYTAVSPIVATKLYDESHIVETKDTSTADPKLAKFFEPFVKDGKLNSLIVLGDTRPHGKYDKANTGAMHSIDIMLLLGKLIRDFKIPTYKLDTEIKDKNLKSNLIIFGSPRDNIVLEKMNEYMPLKFVLETNWSVKSEKTKNIYTGSRKGIIIKCENPLNKKNKVLIFGGIRTSGVRSAVTAVTQSLDELCYLAKNGDLFSVVDGLDKDGDGIIDSVRILE